MKLDGTMYTKTSSPWVYGGGDHFKILSGSTLISVTTTIRKKHAINSSFFIYVCEYHNMTIPVFGFVLSFQ
jgi:hypothetical protein